MKQVTVREYALLTIGEQESSSLDRAYISATAFDYLCELASKFRSNGATLLQVEGRKSLRLDNFVGVIETPCGTQIEILPKHIDESIDASVALSRKLLCKMLSTALDLPNRDVDSANIELFKWPLYEWVIQRFLEALEILINKGLRFDYQRVEEEQKFLRGQLDVARRMRQPVGRAHIFPIRHDIFTPDRAENRLLRAALEKICRVTQEPKNWRLAQELRLLTSEISASRQISQDFSKWSDGRLLAHYQPIKPWCELVLGQHMPMTVKGESRGISLLFPMEKLFESYVAAKLRQSLVSDAKLSTQATTEYLCDHHVDGENEPKPLFNLRPDLLIEHGQQKTILDTKWKRLDRNAVKSKYELKDSDFQQMFAYSHLYLKHQGNIILIYPSWKDFNQPLNVFKFRKTDGQNAENPANLWVVPFDMEKDELVLHPKMLLSINWYKPSLKTVVVEI